jgi:FKBP-type peptidyl-prolyl cis-trans isomerase FkpA
MKICALCLAITGLLSCEPPPEVPIESTTFAAELGVSLAESVKFPSGLYLRNLSLGDGNEVLPGRAVTVRYTGFLANGTKFDSNESDGFRFTPGARQVIAGWEQGVPGMRVGGKRQLIIPPALGYGAGGQGPIPGNAVLVFNITAISVP